MVSREAALYATGGKLVGVFGSGVSKLGTMALGAEKMATATYYTTKGLYYTSKGFSVVDAARGGYAAGSGINHLMEGDYEAAVYDLYVGASALGSAFETAYSLRGMSAPAKPGSLAARQQHIAARSSSEVAARAQKARILKNVHSSRVANNASRFELHSGGWPGNRGFIRGNDAYVTLSPGAQIDRFGGLGGDFAAIRGTPFRKRGMFDWQYNKGYNALKILKPIEDVRMGPARAWAGNPGGAFQFDFERTGRDIEWFVANDYMKIIKGAARPGF